MKKEKKIEIEKKKYILILTIILVLVIGSLIGLGVLLKKDKDTDELGRLTTIYEKNQENPTDKMKGSDVYVRDEEGNILAEHKGEYDIPKEIEENKNKLSDKVDDLVLKFTEGINVGKFSDIYSLFNKAYLDDFEYDLDTFTKYYTFNGKVKSEVMNVKQSALKDRTFITVKFTEQATGYILLADFTLFNDGTIADTEIKTIADINSIKTIDNVTYSMLKRYEVKLGSIFMFEIKNSSDRVVDVTDMLIKNKDTICTYNITSKDKTIMVYPGQTFKFSFKTPNNDTITSLTFKNKQIDDSILDVEVYSKYFIKS